MPILLEAEVVGGTDLIADSLTQMTEALTSGFTSMQTAFVSGAAAIIGIGIVIFAVKWAPKMLMKLFKTISNQ